MSLPTTQPPYRRAMLLTGAGLVLLTVGYVAVAASGSTKAAPHVVSRDFLTYGEGKVTSLPVKAGDIVEAGVEIAFLDDAAAQREYEAAQTNLQGLAAEVKGEPVAVALPSAPAIGGRIVPGGVGLRGTPSFGGSAPSPGRITALPPVSGTPSLERPATKENPGPSEPQPAVSDAPSRAKEALEAANKRVGEAQSEFDAVNETAEPLRRDANAAELMAQQAEENSRRMQDMLRQGAVALNKATEAEVQARQLRQRATEASKKADEAKESLAPLQKKLDAALAEQQSAAAAAAAVPSKPDAPRPQAKPAARSSTPRPRPADHALKSQPSFRIPAPAHVESYQPAPPPAVPTKVDVNLGKRLEFDDRLKEAKARVDAAEKAILSKRVVATRRMRVIEVFVKKGDFLSPGMAVLRFEPLPPTKKSPPPDPEPNTEEPADIVGILSQFAPDIIRLSSPAAPTRSSGEQPLRPLAPQGPPGQ